MKFETGLFVISLLIGLLLGGVIGTVVGYTIMPEKIVLKDKIVEVDKIVEKEIPVTEYVDVYNYKYLLDNAVVDFETEFEDYTVCGGEEYEVAEMSIKKIEDAFSYEITDEDTYKVSYKAKVGYRSDFLEERCVNKYAVVVEYDEEDIDVTATPIV